MDIRWDKEGEGHPIDSSCIEDKGSTIVFLDGEPEEVRAGVNDLP